MIKINAVDFFSEKIHPDFCQMSDNVSSSIQLAEIFDLDRYGLHHIARQILNFLDFYSFLSLKRTSRDRLESPFLHHAYNPSSKM